MLKKKITTQMKSFVTKLSTYIKLKLKHFLISCIFFFKMPCWYFEKKEIRNTPSIQDGLDHATEARYRREGARFIIDAGTKMGLYPYTILYLYLMSDSTNINEG